MDTLILIARPCEMTGLIRWVCDRYYPDTPMDCPVLEDTIRQKTNALLSTYFVNTNDDNNNDDRFDTEAQAYLDAIEDELTDTVRRLTQKGFHIHSVETFSFDGSTRFIMKMHTGDTHGQSLPESDTG